MSSRLVSNSQSSFLSLLSDGITGPYHHAWHSQTLKASFSLSVIGDRTGSLSLRLQCGSSELYVETFNMVCCTKCSISISITTVLMSGCI